MGLAVEEPQSARPLITMLKKEGRRTVENSNEIVMHLKEKFPQADVTTIEGSALATMSMKAQVRRHKYHRRL